MTEQSKIHFKQGSSELPNVNEEGSIYFQTPENNKRNKIYVDSDNTRHLMGGDPSGCVEYLEDTGAIDLGTIANRPTKGITLNPYDDLETSLYPWTDSTLVRRTNQVAGSIDGDTVEEAFAQLNKSIKIGETQKNINEGSSNISWNCNEVGYRYEWVPAVKLGTWSRILSGTTNVSNYGSTFLLSIVHMRSGVVYTQSFSITIGRLHSTSVTKLGGSYYNNIELGIKVSAGDKGRFNIDIFDNNNPTKSSLYDANNFIKAEIRCTLIPIDINLPTLQLHKRIVNGDDYSGGFVAGTDFGYQEYTGEADSMQVTYVRTFSADINFVGNVSGTLVADYDKEDSAYKLNVHYFHNTILTDKDFEEDNSSRAIYRIAQFQRINDSSYPMKFSIGNNRVGGNGGILQLYGPYQNLLSLKYYDKNNRKSSDQHFIPSETNAYIPHVLTTTLGNNSTPVWIEDGCFKTCTGSFLPTVSSNNNGQFLRVVNGVWAPQTVEAAETLTYSAGVSASE